MANLVVDRIFVGYHVVVLATERTHEVVGSGKIRGSYFYILRDIFTGERSSIRRSTLLNLQSDGLLKVTLPLHAKPARRAS